MPRYVDEIANQVIDDIFDLGCQEIGVYWEEAEKEVAEALQCDRQRAADLATFHGASPELVADILDGKWVDLNDEEPYVS